MSENQKPIIEMKNISKRFGRVQALNNINLELRENEVLGLLGDNGSGKSTLIKTLVGIHEPTQGEIFIRGKKMNIKSPREARELGIGTVYQDLALVDELSVATNLFLDRYPKKKYGPISVINWEKMNTSARKILKERLNIEIDPEARVEHLSGGERQAIAIARSLVSDPEVVVMDEPTAALSADSAAQVAELIKTLKAEGLSVLVITHSMDEVFDFVDRIAVLKSGNLVDSALTTDVTRDQIIQMMVEGRALNESKRQYGNTDSTQESQSTTS